MFALAAAMIAAVAPMGAGAADDDGRYWNVADDLVARLEHKWSPSMGAYQLGWGGVETTGNANLLVVHSVAAMKRHRGPARNDAHARQIVGQLLEGPPYVLTPSPAGRPHAPGWTVSMRDLPSYMHMAVDAEVVDGLAFAWRAREELGLSAGLRSRLRRAVTAVARSHFWRWPSHTANQINWPATVMSGYADVTGDASLLRDDLAHHLKHFATYSHWGHGTGNLGPGLRFHYRPDLPLSHPLNVDSAEYASMVASFTRHYERARHRGMPPPPPAARRLLSAWLRRVIAGYWTHGGYMNWDTGYGLERWHEIHKWGLAQQALVGIADCPQLASTRLRRWSRWILDRSFEFYVRQADRGPGGVTDSTLFGLPSRQPGEGVGELGAARVAGNAARAIDAGVTRLAPLRPPPLYAFDPDTGRLAVTTPAYSTAIMPVTQGAFRYGGIELARLHNPGNEPVATIGGRPPAAFGLRVRDARHRRVLVTQEPHRYLGGRPLWLTRAPHGVGVPPTTHRRTAYAGPFTDLRAAGVVRAHSVQATVRHRFTRSFVETSWTVRRRAGRSRLSVDVLFPSRGDNAELGVERPGGDRRPVGRERMRVGERSFLVIESRHAAAYVVVLRSRSDLTARAVATRRQRFEPDPGPTLAVGLVRDDRLSRVRMSARLAPVPSGTRAAEVARRIAWGGVRQ